MQFFIFGFKALFGSIFRATENKLILQKKRLKDALFFLCHLIRPSFTLMTIYYGYQIAPWDPPEYEKNVLKRYTCLGFVKMYGCQGTL